MSSFINVIEKDENGHDAGIMCINRSHVSHAVFYAIDGVFEVFFTTLESRSQLTRNVKPVIDAEGNPVLDENGKPTMEPVDGIGSFSKPISLLFKDKDNIVKIFNHLNGTTYSTKNFPGFDMHKKQQEAIAKAIEEKQSLIIKPGEEHAKKDQGLHIVL